MKVVPHRPWRRALTVLLSLLCVLGLAAASYWWGQRQVLAVSIAPEDAEALTLRLQKADAQITDLTAQLAAAELAAEVDRRASEELRQQLLARSEAMAEIEREVSLLRLMSSKFSTNAQGVGFGSFSVKPTEAQNVYQMRLVVHKLAETGDTFGGFMEAIVVGKRAGKAERLPLHSLVRDDPKQLFGTVRTPVEFRYFQVLEATIELPDGFEPEHVAAKLVSNAKKPLVVEQRLEWLKVPAL